MGQLLLSIKDVTVRFQNHVILSNLNFFVSKDENWALIGESGSGKSALLRTIAGMYNISGGNIVIDDCCHRLIALVETKHHFRNLSNTTNFYYQQRYNSSDSEDALFVEQYLLSIISSSQKNSYWDIERVAKLLKLDRLRDKKLIKLSNGETKRLMIAAALLRNPVLLLLDSPLTGLDAQTRKDFNSIIEQITATGTTVIMTTSPYDIPCAITHIAILKDGKIKQSISKEKFKPEINLQINKLSSDNEDFKYIFSTYTIKNTYKDIVKMNNVHIQYDNKVILDKINWHILPGERWALLGPNAAGKSTLLSLINGDNPQAYANDIVLFDKKRGTGESIWDIKSKIGFVSPELHQYFPLENSCLQVIESGYYDTMGLFRPSNKTRFATVMHWMKALGIEKYPNVLLKSVPVSVQRLCLLARALVKNPALLIFDEPCQGLDEHQQQHFKNLVDTICKRSDVALIYVTHYEQEIPESVTKVLRLDKGKIVN